MWDRAQNYKKEITALCRIERKQTENLHHVLETAEVSLFCLNPERS